jgi:hypothetical protein
MNKPAPAPEADNSLAHDLVCSIADAVVNDFRLASGPDKLASVPRRLSGFFVAANAVRHQLGLGNLEARDVPPAIVQMTRVLCHLEPIASLQPHIEEEPRK